MNKILIVLIVVALGGGVYWYATQSSLSPTAIQDLSSFTSQTQGASPQQKPAAASARTQESAGISASNSQAPSVPAAFVLPEIGISVGTVNGWNCQKRQTTSGHPDWVQLTCYAGQVGIGDPHIALNNAPIAVDEWADLKSENQITVDGKQIVEYIFSVKKDGSDLGIVDYRYTGPTAESSFQLSLWYGAGKPHASAAAASAIGRVIAQSITFN